MFLPPALKPNPELNAVTGCDRPLDPVDLDGVGDNDWCQYAEEANYIYIILYYIILYYIFFYYIILYIYICKGLYTSKYIKF